jgi:uncharacterized protein (DUF305 family)
MKQFLFAAALATSLAACNGNGTQHGGHNDSTSNDAHQHGSSDTTGHQSHGSTDQSMMSLMSGMMDSMNALKPSGNTDRDFAALMKAHHVGAIEMARLEAENGRDAQIRQMAKKMVDDQQREVAQFTDVLSGQQAQGGSDAFFKESMGVMNNMKMDMDHSGSIDKQFVEMMIPHHQTGIDMARVYLKHNPQNEKLKTIARNIIISQQKEIDEMKEWLGKKKS